MKTAAITLNETNLIQKYGRSAAELLKKLLYWTNKSESKTKSKKPIGILINGRRCIYNTNKEWGKQTGYSDRQIQRAVSQLSKDEIVFVGKHSRYGKPPINTLAINDKKLIELGFATHTLSKSTLETTNDITSTLNHYMSPINIEHHEVQKPRNNTVQDMISIWNIKLPNHQTVLTKENGSYLYTSYKNNFNYNMKEWEDYCSFLAGQNSQEISLDLALKFGTINTYKNKHRQFPAQNYQSSTPYNSKDSNQISNDALASAISDQLPKPDINTSKSQEMLDIWNRIFEKKGTVTMTSKLSIQLGQSLKENFNSNLEEWKAYCLSVESSAYLMGEKFELHISTWALKKENIDKVKNGKLGVTKKFNPVIRHIDDAETHIAEMALKKEDPLLNQMRKFFVNIYGAPAYKSWIMHTKFEIENGELSISSDAPFTRDTIKREYYKIFDFVKTNAPNKIEDETSQKADQSITKNKRYTKKTKIIKRCYMPHDIKKKFVFHKNCSITKENIILQYGFILKNNDLSFGDNLKAVATQSEKILTHRQKPNQADINQTSSLNDERRGENTNTIMDTNRQLNNPQGLLDVTLGDISPPPSTKETKTISEELTCDKVVPNETEIANCEYSKMGEIDPLIKENTTPYRKNLPRHEMDSNVVEGGGHLRHAVVPYIRTKILKQHNNNLIRVTPMTNHHSHLNNLSSQQVRNYYFKKYVLEEEKKYIVIMASTLSILLPQSLKVYFTSNLDNSKSYHQSIETSSDLMGNSFNLYVTGAFKKKWFDIINAKLLDVEKIHIPQIRYTPEVECHISKMKIEEKHYPVLHEARKFFVNRYGSPAYKVWIMQVDFKTTNVELVFSVDYFTRDWIKKDYREIFDYIKLNAPTAQNQTKPLQNLLKERDNSKEHILQNQNSIEVFSNQEDVDHTIENELHYDESDLFIEENSNNYPLIISSNQDAIHRTPIEEGKRHSRSSYLLPTLFNDPKNDNFIHHGR